LRHYATRAVEEESDDRLSPCRGNSYILKIITFLNTSIKIASETQNAYSSAFLSADHQIIYLLDANRILDVVVGFAVEDAASWANAASTTRLRELAGPVGQILKRNVTILPKVNRKVAVNTL